MAADTIHSSLPDPAAVVEKSGHVPVHSHPAAFDEGPRTQKCLLRIAAQIYSAPEAT